MSLNPGKSQSIHVRIQLVCAWCIPAFIIIYLVAFIGLAGMQLLGNGILIVFFILCSLIWSAAAFRPDRDPELLWLLNDTSWLFFVMMYPTYVVALGSIALAGFIDRRSQPIFPRWFCFFTLWVALAGTGGGFATFFKTGPFAWDGLLGFWVPVALYLAWLLVLFPLLIRLVKRAALEP